MNVPQFSIKQIKQLEDWLSILVSTYNDHPSHGLARVINYYIERMLFQENVMIEPHAYCHYLTMRKYWRWQQSQH